MRLSDGRCGHVAVPASIPSDAPTSRLNQWATAYSATCTHSDAPRRSSTQPRLLLGGANQQLQVLREVPADTNFGGCAPGAGIQGIQAMAEGRVPPMPSSVSPGGRPTRPHPPEHQGSTLLRAHAQLVRPDQRLTTWQCQPGSARLGPWQCQPGTTITDITIPVAKLQLR